VFSHTVLFTYKRDQLSIASQSSSLIKVTIQPMSQIFSAHSFQIMGILRFMCLRKVSLSQSQIPLLKAILVYPIQPKTLVLAWDKMKPTSSCRIAVHGLFTVLFQRLIKNFKVACSLTWHFTMAHSLEQSPTIREQIFTI